MISYCAKENKEKEKNSRKKKQCYMGSRCPLSKKGSIKMTGIEEFGKKYLFSIKINVAFFSLS